MRHTRTFLAAAALLAAAVPAQAYDTVQFNAPAPIPHVQDVRYADSGKTPYAMNYSDEAAQNLGMKNGQWEAFQSANPMVPTVDGGLDSGRPMLTLQWR